MLKGQALVDAVVLGLIFVVHFGLTLSSPNSRVLDYWNACRIDDWGTVCLPIPSRKPLPWCPDQRDRISALMRSMQKHAPSTMRVVPATCFGTNVQLYYMPKRDEFMINPVIVATEGEKTKWYECQGVRRPFHTSVRVKYINSYFHEHVATFQHVDAMSLECELESTSSVKSSSS